MIFGIGQKIKQVGNVCVHLVWLVLLLRTFFLNWTIQTWWGDSGIFRLLNFQYIQTKFWLIKLVNTYKLHSSTTKTNRVRFAIPNLKLVTLEDDEVGVVDDGDTEEGSDKGRNKRKASRKLSQKSTTDRSCKAEEMARKDVVSSK